MSRGEALELSGIKPREARWEVGDDSFSLRHRHYRELIRSATCWLRNIEWRTQ